MASARRRGRPDGILLDGALLKARRAELGLSQSDLSDLARLGVRTVRTAEQGEPVSPDTAKLIGHALGLAYLEMLRPTPALVRSRLEASGLGPVRPSEGWLDVDAEAPLRDALLDDEAALICVEGPDGIGKTTVTRQVVTSMREAFLDGLVWVAAGRLDTREHLNHVRTEIATCLGFANRLPDPAFVSPEAFDVAFARNFWRWKRLLVLDDIARPELVKAFTAGNPSKVVVTTHRRWVADSLDGTRIRLGPWPAPRIRLLLEAQIGPDRFDADPAGTERLLQMIGGMPLYARLAGSGLRRTRHQTLDDFSERVLTDLDDAENPADGVVRGLRDSIARTLSPQALQAVRDLGVVPPGGHFAERFAVVVVGEAPARVRMLLDELFDAYVLEQVETQIPEPRFQLADWAVGAWGNPSRAALTRMIRAAPMLVDRFLENIEPERVVESIQVMVPTLRGTIGSVVDFLPVDTPAATPDAVPPVPEDTPEGVENVAYMLYHIHPLVRFAPPREIGEWATGAVAFCRRAGLPLEEARCAWLLAWWWLLHAEDLDAACTWGHEATRLAAPLDDPDLWVSMALHTAMLERIRGGVPAAAPHYAAALEAARSTDCDRGLLAGALLHQSAACLFSGGDPDWQAALGHIREVRSMPDDSPRMGVLHAAAAVNEAIIAHQLGEAVDPVAVDDAVKRLRGALAADPMLASATHGLITALGGTPSLPAGTPADFLEIDQIGGEAILQALRVTCAQLGATHAGRVDDSLRDTRLGQLSSLAASGFPLTDPPGASFDLFLPVEPIRELLLADRDAVLRFVAAVRGPEHPAYKAVSEL